MSCSCVYTECDYFFDRCELNTFRAFRTQYHCTECGRLIEQGELYEYLVGYHNDDEPESFITCDDCLSVDSAFFCDGRIYGMMWEDLVNHLNELEGKISSDCLNELTPRARAKVIYYIDDIFQELNAEEEEEERGKFEREQTAKQSA